jgi:hypothetical protein
MSFIEVVKQLQSLLPALLPYITAKQTLFTFLNPGISQDLWPITSILSLLVSATNFNLTKSHNKRTLALNLCFTGLTAATLSFLFMMAIVGKLIFDNSPLIQDYSVQAAFIFIFIGIGLASGWAFAKILG